MSTESLSEISNAILLLDKHNFFTKECDIIALSRTGQHIVKRRILEADAFLTLKK